MCPLGLINVGETCEVVRVKTCKKKNKKLIKSSKSNILNRLEELGLREGCNLEMLNNNSDNSILVKIDNSRIALPHKVSMKIFVRRR